MLKYCRDHKVDIQILDILPKYILTCGQGEVGVKPLTLGFMF